MLSGRGTPRRVLNNPRKDGGAVVFGKISLSYYHDDTTTYGYHDLCRTYRIKKY